LAFINIASRMYARHTRARIHAQHAHATRRRDTRAHTRLRACVRAFHPYLE